MNVSLLKLISARVLDMMKLIVLFIFALPSLIMIVGLLFILKDDPRVADGLKRKSKI